MKYYKTIEDGIITMIGSGSAIHETQTEITKEEYDSLMKVIKDKPVDTFESVYFLAESGMYEPRERTEEEKVEWYVQIVLAGTITMEEVPAEYYDEVYDIVNAPAPAEPEPTYTLDEAAAIIANEVAGNE